MDYEATIGMEVHAELDTQSKMFCTCSADFFGKTANTQICPVCMSYPGTLPVINEQAIEYAIMVGLALNCEIASFSKFDRKNYSYPDLPKGYQISQYDLPLCRNGHIEITADGKSKRIRIHRAHMEEDTAKTAHSPGGSLVDYNRAGVPLLEIVTEPDIHSAEEARQYLISLRTILRYLGVSTADMEKGAMRCEANVSVAPAGSQELGVKTEIKNLNSFRSVKQAIDYEIERQIQALEAGEQVRQVTMGWNERENRTVFQRGKEGAEDYRYFPEPDLPPMEFTAEAIDALRHALPELPADKKARLISEYGIKKDDVQILVDNVELANYFEACVHSTRPVKVAPQTISNWIMGEFLRMFNEGEQPDLLSVVPPQALSDLLVQIEKNTVNANTGKEVLTEMAATGKSAPIIIQEKGLTQISDLDSLNGMVNTVLGANENAVEQYRAGKTSVIGFLIGQVMRASRGKANPKMVRGLLEKQLNDRVVDHGGE